MRRVVTVVAAVVLLVGCTGQQDHSASSTAGATSGAGPTAQSTLPGAENAEAGPVPTVTPAPLPEPDADAQAQYVAIVAPGTDVYAPSVVEAGLSACDRVAFLSQVDDEALAKAVTGGELADVEAAVPLLCPDLTGHLVAALNGFSDGTLTVGTGSGEVAVGRYTAPAPSASCTWTVRGADDAVLAEGAADAKDVAAGQAVSLEVSSGAAAITSDGCRLWVPATS